MNPTILKNLTLAVLLLSCLTSCYKEDMTGCPDPRGNVHISLRLMEGVSSRASRLGDFDITGARVWAFGADSKQVSFVFAELNADGDYEAWMNLPEGDYNFVVWTDNGSVYKVVDKSGIMSRMMLFLDRSHADAITETIPDLLYGNVNGRAIEARVGNYVEVDMTPDTYNINVTVKGLSRSADIWEVSIYNSDTFFLFDHTLFRGDRVFHHISSGKPAGNGLFSTSTRILAPGVDGDPRLVLRNATTGEVRYDRSLVKTIIDAYAANGQTVDFENTYDYDIVLTFDASMGVEVSVNGWGHHTDPTDLE
jgi:hypothetical protein